MSRIKRFTLAHGVIVSLALHTCVAVPSVLWMTYTPRRNHRSPNRLNVELFGMLSNRQTSAQLRRIESPRPESPVTRNEETPEVKPEATPLKEVAHTELHTAPSNAPVDVSGAVRLPSAPSATAESSHASGGLSRAGGDSDQRQQYLGRRSSEAELINAYVAQLTKQVNAHLIYPKEVKKKRLEGVSEVSFVVTQSGEIKPDTLKITRSSGYGVLDANALKTITAVAPFQRPPRELTVSFGIDFTVDR